MFILSLPLQWEKAARGDFIMPKQLFTLSKNYCLCFPEEFMFQLTPDEKNQLATICYPQKAKKRIGFLGDKEE